MSIKEMEGALGIKDEDKGNCPFGNCEDICSKGLDVESCEELYEEWLLEQLS